MTARGGKFGCNICSSIKSFGPAKEERLSVSREWSENLITCSGFTREGQLTNFRVKIKKHLESESHKFASEFTVTNGRKAIEKSVEKITAASEETTANVFKTAYYIALSDRPYSDFESLIELQQLNGVDLGMILHSRRTCANIIDHISTSMRRCLTHNFVKSEAKMAVLRDESSLSNKSLLIVNIKAAVDNGDPTYIFLNLVELQSQDAAHIETKLLTCLTESGLSRVYLKNNWVAFASDRANVMTGKKSGVATRLHQKYPMLVTWHCMNHRPELTVVTR